MKLELVSFDEATNVATLDTDEEARQLLMEKGFNAILREALERIESDDDQRQAGTLE